MANVNCVRYSNIELLRLLSISLIQLMHIVSIVHQQSNLLFINIQVENLINVIGNTGVTIFVLISGWFGINFKKDRIVDFVLISIVYSIILSFIQDGVNLFAMLNAVYQILSYQSWFMACYFILYMVSPFVNEYILKTDRSRLRTLIIILVVFLGGIPTLLSAPNGTVIYWGGKCLGYFLTLYIIGRYMRLYHEDGPLLGGAFLMFLIPFILLYGLWFVVSLLPVPYNNPHNYLVNDSSPFILIEAIGIFYMFKKIKFQSLVINSLAGSVFSIYLMGNIYKTLDAQIFNLVEKADRYTFVFYLIGEFCSAVLICILIDKVYRLFFGNVHKWLVQYIVKLTECGYNRINYYLEKYAV